MKVPAFLAPPDMTNKLICGKQFGIPLLTTFATVQWLVVVGVCTHLGCVPLPNAGDYHGWFLPVPRQPLRHIRPRAEGPGALQSGGPGVQVP